MLILNPDLTRLLGVVHVEYPLKVEYQALTSMYFCERYGLQLPVRYADVMSLLPTLRPYPSPRSRCYRDAASIDGLRDYRWRGKGKLFVLNDLWK